MGNNLVRGCQRPAATNGNLPETRVERRQPWALCVLCVGGSGSSLGAQHSISPCSCFKGVTQSLREVEGWVASEGHSLLHLQMSRQRCYFICRHLGSWERWLGAVSAET